MKKNCRHLLLTSVALAAFVAAGCEKAPESRKPDSAKGTDAQHTEVAKAPPGLYLPDAEQPAAKTPTAEVPVPAHGDSVAMAGEGPAVGNRMPAYKSTLKRPDAVSMKASPFDVHAATQNTVYIVNSTTCPTCKVYVDRMKAIETKYMALGVDVIHVYSVDEETPEDKLAYHAKHGFKGGIIVDQDARFPNGLDITRTPTVVLADAKGTILYHGRIDNAEKPADVTSNELANALDQHLAGKPVTVSTTEPAG